MSEIVKWWNGLDRAWRFTLVINFRLNNRHSYIDFAKHNFSDEFLALDETSKEIITKILEIRTLKEIKPSIFQNPEPLYRLGNLNEINIRMNGNSQEKASLLLIPKIFRSKVVKLNVYSIDLSGGFSFLEDFTNIEEFFCSDCNIESLNGIQCFSKLKSLNISDNHIVDLQPLKSLPIQRLFISDTKITSLDYIDELKQLNYLNIGELDILDFSPLKKLKKFKTLSTIKSNRQKTIKGKKLEDFLSKY